MNKCLIFFVFLMSFEGEAMKLSYSQFQGSKKDYYSLREKIRNDKRVVSLSDTKKNVESIHDKAAMKKIFSSDIMSLLSECAKLFDKDFSILSSGEDYIEMKITEEILGRFSMLCETITNRVDLMDTELKQKLAPYIMQ